MARKTIDRDVHEGMVRDLQRNLNLNEFAVAALARNEVTWFLTVAEKRILGDQAGPGKHRFGVADLTGAHGGLFFNVYIYPGQRDQVRVRFLDEINDEASKANPAGDFYKLFRGAVADALLQRDVEWKAARKLA